MAREGATLQQAIADAARAHPSGGFTFENNKGEGRFVSFPDLDRETAIIAARLTALGLKKGDRVALTFNEPENFVLAFLAATRLGLVAVPVFPPPTFGGLVAYLDRMAGIQKTAGSRVFVTSQLLIDKLQTLAAQVPCLEEVVAIESLRHGVPAAEFPALAPDDVAFLQFTSGSTQDPRGVTVTHRMLVANSAAIMGRGGLKADPARDVGICWVPLYHDMGMVGFVVAPLCWHVSTVFVPTIRFLRNPSVWMDAMHRHRGTISWGPNFSYALASRKVSSQELERWDLSCVRVLGCGGEPVNPSVMRKFTEALAPTGLDAKALRPGYGLAECTLTVSLTPLDHGMLTVTADRVLFEREGRVADPVPNGPSVEYVSVGRIVNGLELRIVSEDGEILSDGREGEIQIKGPSVTPGYFGNPSASAELLREGWLRTGDLGFSLSGEIFVTGRKKDLIIYNGHNIHPQSVEWSVARIEGVREGSVVAFSVSGAETERVVVAIEIWGTEPDQIISLARNRVLQELALALHEVICVGRGTIPKTSSGKLQRWRVRADYLKGTLAKAAIPVAGGESGPLQTEALL